MILLTCSALLVVTMVGCQYLYNNLDFKKVVKVNIKLDNAKMSQASAKTEILESLDKLHKVSGI